VIGILDIESTDELDQIIMAGLPRAEYLTFEQVLTVREYASFAEDIRQRWGVDSPNSPRKVPRAPSPLRHPISSTCYLCPPPFIDPRVCAPRPG
jgi:hypothetical protein